MADNINPRADGTGTIGRIAARWANLFSKAVAFAYQGSAPTTAANHTQIYADASGVLHKVTGGGVDSVLAGVAGPASSVDGDIALFNGTDGQTIKTTGVQLSALALDADLSAHIADLANPHQVTFTQAGAEEAGVAAGLVADHVADASDPHNAAGYMNQATADTLYDALGASAAVQANLDDHTGDTDNPHGTTAAQTGATSTTHTHDATGSNGPKLAQANTHQSPDTDTATTALHHTIGTGANQAAAGNHTHALTDVSITGATADTDPDDTDVAPIYSADAAANRKVTLANLKTYYQTGIPLANVNITGATADTDPDDTDEAAIYSADATANRKVALSVLKTYFQDGLDYVDGPATHAANYVPQWNGTPDSETLVEGFPITALGKTIANSASTTAAQTATETPSAINLQVYGFTDRSETSIGFNDSTYVFTLTDAGSGWSYYRAGIKYTISGNKTVTIPGTPPTAGTYYIYIDATDGTLSQSGTAWALTTGTKVPVAILCFNNTLTPKYCLADERHTCQFLRREHSYEHLTTGTRVQTAGALSGYAVAPASPADTDNDFAIAESIIWDEDIQITCSAVTGGSTYHIEYRTAASTWAWVEQSLPFKYGTYIQWDNAGTATDAAANKYVNYFLLATNGNANARYVLIPGQAEHANLAAAQAEKFGNLTLTGLQFQEVVALWQITFQTSAAYSSTGKCRIAAEPVRITTSLVQAGTGSVTQIPMQIGVACSDETTDLTTGTAKVKFRMPCAMTLTEVRGSLSTAATGANLLTVDVNEGGTSVLSTKLTIDASETTSTTAATPAVISDSALANDAEITIDIDQVGNTTPGKGLKVWLIGTRA